MATTVVARRHAPVRSSPLASTPASSAILPPSAPLRAHSFPASRPLCPFASIAPKTTSKPVKIIEPPESFRSGIFMLNLTQAEFSRQDYYDTSE